MRKVPCLMAVCALIVSCDRDNAASGTNETSSEGIRRSKHRYSAPALAEQREARETRRKALKSVTGLPTSEERNQELAKIAWDSLELDPTVAEDAFSQLIPGSEEKNRLIEHLALSKAEKNIDEAKKWAESLESKEEKSLAYGNIAVAWAETAPELAASLLSEQLLEGRDGSVAVTKVVQRWAAQNPQDAIRWSHQFKEGEAREAGIRAALSSWHIGDSKSPEVWISELPTEQLRMEAIKIYAEVSLDQPNIVPHQEENILESPTADLERVRDQIRIQTDFFESQREQERASNQSAE